MLPATNTAAVVTINPANPILSPVSNFSPYSIDK